MNIKTNTYSFVAILRPIELDQSQLEDNLFAAGCDDATIGIRNGVVYLDFDREAPCFEEAILSAIAAIEGSDIGARVAWIEPGFLARPGGEKSTSRTEEKKRRPITA